MIVEVLIVERWNGVLEARVVQGGQTGANLLRGRSLTNVDAAQAEVKRILARDLQHWTTDLDIRWTIRA